jgi:hypothetical protein
MMDGTSEYIVVNGVEATFEALRDAVHQRQLPVVEEDPQHLRLAFRLNVPHERVKTKVECAVIDVEHGLSELVVVCTDEVAGEVVAPDASLTALFMQVEHTLHTSTTRQKVVRLPPIQYI